MTGIPPSPADYTGPGGTPEEGAALAQATRPFAWMPDAARKAVEGGADPLAVMQRLGTYNHLPDPAQRAIASGANPEAVQRRLLGGAAGYAGDAFVKSQQGLLHGVGSAATQIPSAPFQAAQMVNRMFNPSSNAADILAAVDPSSAQKLKAGGINLDPASQWIEAARQNSGAAWMAQKIQGLVDHIIPTTTDSDTKLAQISTKFGDFIGQLFGTYLIGEGIKGTTPLKEDIPKLARDIDSQTLKYDGQGSKLIKQAGEKDIDTSHPDIQALINDERFQSAYEKRRLALKSQNIPPLKVEPPFPPQVNPGADKTARLEQSGWTKAIGADGSVVYNHPGPVGGKMSLVGFDNTIRHLQDVTDGKLAGTAEERVEAEDLLKTMNPAIRAVGQQNPLYPQASLAFQKAAQLRAAGKLLTPGLSEAEQGQRLVQSGKLDPRVEEMAERIENQTSNLSAVPNIVKNAFRRYQATKSIAYAGAQAAETSGKQAVSRKDLLASVVRKAGQMSPPSKGEDIIKMVQAAQDAARLRGGYMTAQALGNAQYAGLTKPPQLDSIPTSQPPSSP